MAQEIDPNTLPASQTPPITQHQLDVLLAWANGLPSANLRAAIIRAFLTGVDAGLNRMPYAFVKQAADRFCD